MARIRFHRILPAVFGAGLLSLGAVGCVSQEDYMALKMDRDNLAEQNADLARQAEGHRRLADSLQDQISKMGQAEIAGTALGVSYEARIAALQAERDQLLSKYEAMLKNVGTGPLPEPLTNELTQFAEENPDLLTFDQKNGIVKFKSDVTFASGDAELTPGARDVLAKFARILNGPIASNYRLEIAGHTDNVPVSNPLTKSKGHKDNWYLSSHRAISVGQELMKAGIRQNRIGVTGYADQHPAAPNTSDTGRQQNRRVEVLILPAIASTAEPTQAAAVETPDAAEPAAQPQQSFSK